MMNNVYNEALHRYAVFTACCTFLLLIAGALVTSNDAGLSIPDWPLAYGSLTPPMVGGIRYEFTHRVIATCIGILTIGLATWLWRAEKRSMDALAGLGGPWRGHCAGNPRRHDRSDVSIAAGVRRARHSGSAFLFHRRGHCRLYQFLVEPEHVPEIDDPGSPRVRTLMSGRSSLFSCSSSWVRRFGIRALELFLTSLARSLLQF